VKSTFAVSSSDAVCLAIGMEFSLSCSRARAVCSERRGEGGARGRQKYREKRFPRGQSLQNPPPLVFGENHKRFYEQHHYKKANDAYDVVKRELGIVSQPSV
jgi:hypothetical protein